MEDNQKVQKGVSSMNQIKSKQLNEQLFEAVLKEDIDRVEALINEGADPNTEGVDRKYGYHPITVLCIAVEEDNEELVRTLLQAPNIDVNRKDFAGDVALHRAAINGCIEVVEALLSMEKIDVNVGCKKYGNTPLIYASRRGHDEVVETLLKFPGILVNQKDKSGNTSLHESSYKGHTEIVDMLLEVPGILVNEKDDLHSHTPLHLAADSRHADAVEALLSHPDIDVNVQDKYGQTPLHTSAYYGDLKVIEMLLNAGINVNEKNKDGQTAAYWAGKQGHAVVVEKIVNHAKYPGASDGKSWKVNALAKRAKRIEARKEKEGSNRKGNDPNVQLLLGARNNDLIKVEELLNDPTIDVNSVDKNRNTPLHLASDKGHTEIVKMLLKVSGIDVNAKNKDKRKLIYPVHPGDDPDRAKLDVGKTPLHLAVDGGHLEVVKVLLSHPGIDVNAKDKYDTCPLLSAVDHSKMEMIEALLNHPDIEVNYVNVCSDHFSLLHTAVEKCDIEVVKKLLSHPKIDVNIKDKFYVSTPLNMAIENNDLQIVEAILNNPKVNVNALDKFGRTAFQNAFEKGNLDIMKHLKEASTNLST